jgi:hypothetical protein
MPTQQVLNMLLATDVLTHKLERSMQKNTLHTPCGYLHFLSE